MNSPSKQELEPLASFENLNHHAASQQQYAKLKSLAEPLRQLGVIALSDMGGQRAHAALDDMLREIHRASVRAEDVHLLDAGIHPTLAEQFKSRDIYTLGDLANCNPPSLMAHINVIQIMNTLRLALSRSIELAG